MIFTARQLQEKCQEQNVDRYMTFVDLTKTFDTVSREGLWKVSPSQSSGILSLPQEMIHRIIMNNLSIRNVLNVTETSDYFLFFFFFFFFFFLETSAAQKL